MVSLMESVKDCIYITSETNNLLSKKVKGGNMVIKIDITRLLILSINIS